MTLFYRHLLSALYTVEPLNNGHIKEVLSLARRCPLIEVLLYYHKTLITDSRSVCHVNGCYPDSFLDSILNPHGKVFFITSAKNHCVNSTAGVYLA